jgi:hypothetical protein
LGNDIILKVELGNIFAPFARHLDRPLSATVFLKLSSFISHKSSSYLHANLRAARSAGQLIEDMAYRTPRKQSYQTYGTPASRTPRSGGNAGGDDSRQKGLFANGSWFCELPFHWFSR